MNAVSRLDAMGNTSHEWLAECRAMEADERTAEIAAHVETLNARVLKLRSSDRLHELLRMHTQQMTMRDDAAAARTAQRILAEARELAR